MDENFDKLIEQFMADHEDLFREAKWCLLMDITRNAKTNTDPAVVDTLVKFLQVFRDHNVDPDIVIEAINVLGEENLRSKKQESDDISQDEFTNFVNVLNKMRKKGEENATEK